MNGGSLSAVTDTQRVEEPELLLSQAAEPCLEYNEPAPSITPLVPILGAAAAIAWLGVAIWLSLPLLQAPPPPVEMLQWIAALCVPLALIGIIVQLALRTSRAEAQRFGATARSMRAEAGNLEHVLAIMADRIDENRVRLNDHTGTLMALGDAAAERLAAISNGISHEVTAIETQAHRLTQAATSARADMSVLLATLPKAHAQTRELKCDLERTGLAASERASALEAQLSVLTTRGREADEVVGGAAQRLAAHLAKMEATSETAGNRLEETAGQMTLAVDAVLARAAGAVDEARKGISAQGEAMLAMVGANQAALERAGSDTVEALAGRIAEIDATIDRIGGRLTDQRGTGATLIAELDHGIDRVSARLTSLDEDGAARLERLTNSVGGLSADSEALIAILRDGGEFAGTMIGRAEDLLVALDSSAREIDETLPEALARLDARVAATRGLLGETKPELVALASATEKTHDAVEAVAGIVREQRETTQIMVEALTAAFADGESRAEALGVMIDETVARANGFAEDAAPRLVDALLRVRDTASAAAERARETLEAVIPQAARSLETATGAAMARALNDRVAQQMAEVSHAAEHAVVAATKASDRLMRQMLTIADTTAAVEARIEEVREANEAATHDSFGRRAALLIESLNSASIDITKGLSNETSDTAWAAYLKGDRGVFTRRAVRLLNAHEVRDIARRYDDDAEFRDQVNRYIHDFEAMLRSILAQRDGSPLGVTILSSDMGKLYVALAQAIERLRT